MHPTLVLVNRSVEGSRGGYTSITVASSNTGSFAPGPEDGALDLLSRAFPPDSRAPKLAREALSDLPASLRPDLDRLRLMVSELVTNSVRHARPTQAERVELSVVLQAAHLRVEVKDPGGGFESAHLAWDSLLKGGAASKDATPLHEEGYGLRIVAALADRCGVRWDAGTVVWFEIDRPRDEASSG